DEVSTIDGIRCESMPLQNIQTYAHLDIFVDGKTQQVPAGIGVVNNTCRYWMYTQDMTGIIHINSPENAQFTISQFFDIWKATSNLPPTGIPIIYLNGQKTSSSMNDTEINPHDEIAIIYGSKPAIIPSSYQFLTSS
ncbi:MAG: hypothetical protein KGI25_08770, partial [Thaumarchaeota archaeon]|nr:hypothetical protein [Nitrososphaerota archaeon]